MHPSFLRSLALFGDTSISAVVGKKMSGQNDGLVNSMAKLKETGIFVTCAMVRSASTEHSRFWEKGIYRAATDPPSALLESGTCIQSICTEYSIPCTYILPNYTSGRPTSA
jgi:hypothetical protein